MMDIRQEITPVESDDLFVVLDHWDAKFDYPIHCHAEYEINLVTWCSIPTENTSSARVKSRLRGWTW